MACRMGKKFPLPASESTKWDTCPTAYAFSNGGRWWPTKTAERYPSGPIRLLPNTFAPEWSRMPSFPADMDRAMAKGFDIFTGIDSKIFWHAFFEYGQWVIEALRAIAVALSFTNKTTFDCWSEYSAFQIAIAPREATQMFSPKYSATNNGFITRLRNGKVQPKKA